MSNLRDLQGFLNKERRNPDLGPVKRKEPPDNRGVAGKEKDALDETTKAMAEDREKSKIDSAREGMSDVLRDRLEDEGITKPSPPLGTYMMEKDGGGDGGGGLAGGGTVAVASDPGVFTATYGGDSKRRLGMDSSKKKKKKKKKKEKEKDKYQTSGVIKLDRFLRGEKVNQITNSKSMSVEKFAEWVVNDVRKALKPENRDTTGGVGVNEPPTTGTHRGKVRNPWGRGGKFKPLKGQQGYTMDFVKMENISNALQSRGTVLDLIKALDMDIPIEVN